MAKPTATPTPPKPKQAPVLCAKCNLAYAIKSSPEHYCMGCENRLLKSIAILKDYGYAIER